MVKTRAGMLLAAFLEIRHEPWRTVMPDMDDDESVLLDGWFDLAEVMTIFTRMEQEIANDPR